MAKCDKHYSEYMYGQENNVPYVTLINGLISPLVRNLPRKK